MNNVTFMWPPELIITESLFRHFTGLAEIAGYLKDKSKVVKNNEIQIKIVDCAVSPYTALNIAAIARSNILVPIYINMNNIFEAISLTKFLKSVNPNVCIAVYGEAVSCNPIVFSEVHYIDYVISNGNVEYALDYILCSILNIDRSILDFSEKEIKSSGKNITVSKLLPSESWGEPPLELLPLDNYLNLSKGEIHLLINKGCPFFCEFCNERIVSSNILRYRSATDVANFLCRKYEPKIKSVYLDASTFTYSKEWVFLLANEIKRLGKPLPWKTCTRLDCLDEELIKTMAESGCTRISIGVETLDDSIQKRNRKVVSKDKLISFAKYCHKYGITPRALFIIGLEGQSLDDIEFSQKFCNENEIDGRFRVLQDYSVLINCKTLDELDIVKLDRWNTWNPFKELNISELREIEYPLNKGGSLNYV